MERVLSKTEIMEIMDLFTPAEYSLISDLFSKLHEEKQKTMNAQSLIATEETKTEREKFLQRKEELERLVKIMPDIEISKYLYSISFDQLPISESTLLHLSRILKYLDRLKPQEEVILRQTIVMFNDHMQNLEQSNPGITNYKELLDKNLFDKTLLVENNVHKVLEYMLDVYGLSIRHKELGFTFSYHFNPEKEIGEGHINKAIKKFSTFLARYSSYEKLSSDDYSDVKKLMYIRK